MTHATALAVRTCRSVRPFVAAALLALAVLPAVSARVAANEWWVDDGLGQGRSAVSFGAQPEGLVGALHGDAELGCGVAGSYGVQGAARHAC